MANANPFSYYVSVWLVRWRWWLLAIAALLVVVAYPYSQRLSFDRSIENMFAPDDPLLKPYRQLKRVFAGNEIALAAYEDPQLMTPEGIARVRRLTELLAAVPGVQSVLSLTTTPLGEGIIDTTNPLAERFQELFEGYTVSDDRTVAAVVCMLVPQDQTDASRDAAVEQLREIVEAPPYGGVLTGEPVMVVEGFRYVDEDGARLGRTSTALLMLTIILCFRSLRWTIAPIVMVNVTLILTKATLVVLGFELSMVSSMMWAIVTVTGIAMAIHIVVRFREARGMGYSTGDALIACGTALAAPIAWTCCTDAGGFGSLLAARVGPVQDFGVMMLLASLLAIVSAALVLPGLVLWGRVDSDPQRAWGEGGLDFGLREVVRVVETWPRSLAVLSVVVVATAAIGYRWLEVETDFTKNFRASSPIVKSYEFVENRLGGAGVLDVIVPVEGKLDWAFLDRVQRLEERLRNEVRVRDASGRLVPGLTKVLSVADAMAAVSAEGFRKTVGLDFFLTQFQSQMPAAMQSLLGTDPESGQTWLRVMLRAQERQPSAEKDRVIEQVSRITREEFGGEAQVTGFFVLLTNLIDSMIRDQWFTFSIALVAIGLMMLVAFRSVGMAVAALIPNVLPIIVVTGLMGWLGVRINMGSAMIAAVSMGLAIDSSIHYISMFRYLRHMGMPLDEAIGAVHQSVGRAMTFSTLALVVGFSALVRSEFVPIIYFGVLVSLAMLGGWVGNLVVLPLLLRAFALRTERKAREGTLVPVGQQMAAEP